MPFLTQNENKGQLLLSWWLYLWLPVVGVSQLQDVCTKAQHMALDFQRGFLLPSPPLAKVLIGPKFLSAKQNQPLPKPPQAKHLSTCTHDAMLLIPDFKAQWLFLF